MKPSTVAELVGFVLVSVAAWMLSPVAGVATAGVSCLFIGYAMDDGQVEVSARRIVAPIVRRHVRRKDARRLRRAAKDG